MATSSNATPVETKAQLVAYLEQGAKPKHLWTVGTEHEKFGFTKANNRPLSYDSIREILTQLERFKWSPILEHDRIIALKRGQASITLEPGGQFELSGAPLATLHQTFAELETHFNELREVTQARDIAFFGMGFHPLWPRDDIPKMPKARYDIMRAYMPTRGNLGLDMMSRTCTVQANLDFSSEADMVQKFRVSLAIQPIVTALFANSPFKEGKPNGYLSYRSFAWTDTDPDRCGTLPFVFEPGMGFERYVDYALDVPMYFVKRNDEYISAAGQSFRDFMVGKLPALPNELPTLDDWANHLTTAFPEVRLKQYLEMRGADCGPGAMLPALPALFVGCLYDSDVLLALDDLTRHWTAEERLYLRKECPRLALKTPFRGALVRDVAQKVVDLARQGLHKRAIKLTNGRDESMYLEVLDGILQTGRTLADDQLERFNSQWQKRVEPAIAECTYY